MQFRHVYMNFRQNFSQKQIYFRHFRKKLSPRLLIAYPKAYAKETPFMDLLLNSHINIYLIEFSICFKLRRISIRLHHLYFKSHRSLLSREVCLTSPWRNMFCFPWVKHHWWEDITPRSLALLAAKTLVKILRDGIALLCLEIGGRK